MIFRLDYEKDYRGIFIVGDGIDRVCLNRYSPKPGSWDDKYTLTRYVKESKVIGVDEI
jgi:hypothetical protein